MKNFFSLTVALMMMLSVFSLSAFAAETQPAESATVYVTVADGNGDLAIKQEAITVTDRNEDGVLTVDEALYAAHEAKYEGSAAAGYGSANTEYGLSLTKLWGDTSGSFGYYINNASAWSLADTVKEGDYVNAFVYTDPTTWTDKYCFYDQNTVFAAEGDTMTLTLSYAGYDADYNPVVLPVEGATVTIDGVATEYKTDAEGKVTITLDRLGAVLISATSDSMILVPPVCMAFVAEKADESTAEESTAEETTVEESTAEVTTVEETTETDGEGCGSVIGVGSLAVVLASAAAAVVLKRKEN